MHLYEKIKSYFKNFPFYEDRLELTQEKENEILEKIVQKILKSNIDFPILIYLYRYLPVSTIVTDLTILPFAPLLELFGIQVYDYIAFFRKKENVKKLIDHIQNRKIVIQNK